MFVWGFVYARNQGPSSFTRRYTVRADPCIAWVHAPSYARMHGVLFLQAHQETEDYFAFTGTPAQPDQDKFRFRRAAFYSGLKSKVGLIASAFFALAFSLLCLYLSFCFLWVPPSACPLFACGVEVSVTSDSPSPFVSLCGFSIQPV
jgi:hypothetical protein